MVNSSDNTVLGKHCDMLMEHYDSVLILATTHNIKDNATDFFWESRGNRFANSGAAQAWLTRDVEENINSFQKDKDEEED